jgi:tetratricopeptide (TPR) repeat protein
MDQFSAHLDRGWDLVQRGDSQGAEMSARRALELDGQSPEALNLLGYVCALQGSFEEAVEHYSQAIALDDTYLEAMLNAAEVYVHPLGDFDQAIQMCELALDLAENDDELVDALLLKFDALLGKNDPDAAREVCRCFPSGPFENPNHAFLVARAYYEIGEVEQAAPLVEEAARSAPDNPEAHYYLGLLRDERGDTNGATQAYLRSRELDFAIPSPPWSLSAETFLMTVRQAVAALDPALREYLRTDEIFVADVPGVEVVVEGVDPRGLVLLDAIAPRSEGEKPSARLFVYQRNVERLAGTVEAVQPELRAALEREITATFLDPERPPPADEPIN